MSTKRMSSVGRARVDTMRALRTVSAIRETRKEIEMSTPAFDETVRHHMGEAVTPGPVMVVTMLPGVGPALVCAGCGTLSDVHSTNLDVLTAWGNEHRARVHG